MIGARSAWLDTMLARACLSVWILVLNCLQNLLLAPRATARVADLRATRAPGPWPRVSILVPARDEATNIEGCLRGLLAQSYPATEIIVCDDGSTDDTAAIVRALAAERGAGRLRLLAGAARPPGWSGKNWACHQLAEAARGDWLLFTDADTRHGPESVAAALALAWQHDAGLVSLLPRQRAETIGERLLVTQLPLIIWGVLPLALVGVRAPWSRPFLGANGLYLFFRRDWYDALGGYRAVRAAIAEDMQFARETKRRGGRLVLADGGAVLECRMYRDFADAWRGLSRNAFPAALESSPVFLLFVAAWAFVFVLPLGVLAAWAVRRAWGGPPGPPMLGGARALGGDRLPSQPPTPLTPCSPQHWGAGGALLGQLVLRLLAGRHHARPAWEALLQPASSVLTLAVLLNSCRLHRLGGAFEWRGRRYGAASTDEGR